ncbi:Dachshund -like protein 1 [Trichinella pseudospiralis]|uniref:Dachshund-like protein 1 n=1 Tax=Trichinella pseudospiralis TaxID=6337 RepID=A0A0V1J7J0_TRIPS|nr:Dachshund -like protein 1 [Trichinella pseudospiralis]
MLIPDIFFVYHPEMRQTSMLYFVSKEKGNTKESLKFINSESSSCLVNSLPYSKPRSRTVGSLNCDEDQMILDAGQKEFGNKYCTVCGMHYNPDNGNDFLSHEKYHRQIVKPTFFMNKCQERMVPKIVQFSDSFIGKINLCKGESAIKPWIARIVQFACNEIGSSFDELFSKEYNYQLYIFVNERRRLEISGLLLVEHQHRAFPRMQFMIDERECCSVLMGVVMIWIAPSCRRKRIATRLLDFARNNFLLGTNIQTSEIAFTDLTPAGLKFAENYCHSNILLYHRVSTIGWLFIGIARKKRAVFIFLILCSAKAIYKSTEANQSSLAYQSDQLLLKWNDDIHFLFNQPDCCTLESDISDADEMLDDEREQASNKSKSFAISKSNPTSTSPDNGMEERLRQLMNIGSNGCSMNTTGAVEAQLIEYRGQKVAAFRTDLGTLICLPQAYELFLKHLVGGLHTVYTKLKRLDVTPIVCNVEQVRALRSIGAIQPGVNRCKLISCHDFDTLLKDCATSNSRPGRPPKRSSSDALYHQSLLPDSLGSENSYTTINQQTNALNEKQMKFSDKNSHGVNNSMENRNGPHGQMTSMLGVASSQINSSLFPFLPMTPQQLFLTQMLSNNMVQNPFSVASTAAAAAANARSWTDIEALILGKSNSERTKTTNQESQLVDDDLAQRQSTAAEEECFSVNNNYTIENLLISASGMMELALATVRRVDSQQQKDKMEMLKALETEKRNRAHLENLLKEKEQSEKINAKCVKEMKATIADLQLRLSVCTQASNDSSIAQTSPPVSRKGENHQSHVHLNFIQPSSDIDTCSISNGSDSSS